jgi:hypothetical protein
MNLSRTQKIVVGIFTLLPFFLAPYILYEIFHFIMNTISMSEQGDPEPEIILAGVLSFLGPIILCAITSLGLLIFYIMHCIANKTINSTERVIWILVFIFIGIISFPVYWLMRVWNEGK